MSADESAKERPFGQPERHAEKDATMVRESTHTAPKTPSGARGTRRGIRLLLREGITLRSFAAFLAATMTTIAGLVFINAEQTCVMIDILNYSASRVGDAAGTLVLADELLSLVLVPLWGAASDRVGRRGILSFGLFIMAVATALHPWAVCVFPTDNDARSDSRLAKFASSMLAMRMLFAVGGSAATSTVTALVGDYAAEGGRARISGLTGIASGVGAIFSALFLSRVPVLLVERGNNTGPAVAAPPGGRGLVIAFTLTATLLLISAAIAAFMLLDRVPDLPSPAPVREDGGKRTAIIVGTLPQSLVQRMAGGLRAAKRPAVALAYAAGFIARADSIALHLFVQPWVYKHMVATGQCPAGVTNAFANCPAAKRHASTIMGVADTAVLLGAPIFGVLCDRQGAVRAVLAPAVLGVVAHATLAALRVPEPCFLLYAAAATAGLANIGMIIASMALMSAVSAPEERGALSGVFSACGALGIIVTSKLGGLLFDRVFESSAFSVVAVASVIHVAMQLYVSRNHEL